jgi:monovalent cation:H+ antiporter-2, CPA2 family
MLAALVVLLLLAVLAVVVCRRLQLPPIIGYLGVGLAVGPHAAGLVQDNAQMRLLAEFGVLFLLFSIGLEFSLNELKALRKTVFRFGLWQLAITASLAGFAAFALGASLQAAIAIGGAVAISSTAIGIKMLSERGELSSEHGKRVVGVLLFQDIAVIPFLILLPTLARGGDVMSALGIAALKAVVALAIILKFGRPLMAWWMRLVAARRTPELFMLNILLVTLGLSYATEHSGLSLGLGAFMAGMLIAETEFRYQVEEDIKPFRDVLLGFFFVTLGMQLNVAEIAPQILLVLALVVVLIAVKFALIFGILKVLKTPLATSIRTGIYLSQAGEFSFVLISLAGSLNTLDPRWQQVLLSAMILSLLVSPLLIAQSEKIVRKLTANDWMARAVALTQLAATRVVRQDHIIVCGYGRSGQFLGRLLDAENIPWFALDNDPARVREASAAGAPVSYGDASRAEVLKTAGIESAKAVVISFTDIATAKRIIRAATKAHPHIPIIVRTLDDADIAPLMAAGATEVVPEVLEGSLMLASQAMLSSGTPLNRVLKRIRAVREERYNLFRGFFHGATDTPDSDAQALRMHAIVVPENARCLTKPLSQAAFPKGVSVHSVRRGSRIIAHAAPDFALEAGDRVVVLGTLTGIAKAQDWIATTS